MLSLSRLREVPPAALWPGLAGLLPFVGAAAALALVDAPWRESLRQALVGYGALILTFVGAIHWGIGLMAGGRAAPSAGSAAPADEPLPGARVATAGFCFAWSVLPALWAWLALAAGFVPALLLLGVGFIVQLAVDVRVAAALALPAWYLALRSLLTSGVLLCLLLASLATALSA